MESCEGEDERDREEDGSRLNSIGENKEKWFPKVQSVAKCTIIGFLMAPFSTLIEAQCTGYFERDAYTYM